MICNVNPQRVMDFSVTSFLKYLSMALLGKDSGKNSSSFVGTFFSPAKDNILRKDDPAKDDPASSSVTDLL